MTLMRVDDDRWLTLLGEFADRADEIALRLFRSPDLRVDEKIDLTPVSEADRAIEAIARQLWREQAPGLGILGEEEGESKGSGDTRLIIDPIDATRNFVRGIPIFATLLAIEVGPEVVAGLVSAPALGMRWQAARGHGAYCANRRLQVSGVRALDQAQIFHSGIGGSSEPQPVAGFNDLLSRAHRTRGFGDFYQHMLVAEGAGELGFDPEVKPWDVAALQVIVEEAGGRVTSVTGERSIYAGSLLSTNGHLHDEALTLLNPKPPSSPHTTTPSTRSPGADTGVRDRRSARPAARVGPLAVRMSGRAAPGTG